MRHSLELLTSALLQRPHDSFLLSFPLMDSDDSLERQRKRARVSDVANKFNLMKSQLIQAYETIESLYASLQQQKDENITLRQQNVELLSKSAEILAMNAKLCQSIRSREGSPLSPDDGRTSSPLGSSPSHPHQAVAEIHTGQTIYPSQLPLNPQSPHNPQQGDPLGSCHPAT